MTSAMTRTINCKTPKWYSTVKNAEMNRIGGSTLKAKINALPAPKAFSSLGGSAKTPNTNLAPLSEKSMKAPTALPIA